MTAEPPALRADDDALPRVQDGAACHLVPLQQIIKAGTVDAGYLPKRVPRHNEMGDGFTTAGAPCGSGILIRSRAQRDTQFLAGMNQVAFEPVRLLD